MKPSHLEVLQHSLGADKYGQLPKHYEGRNYYWTEETDPEVLELVALGFMVQHQAVSWCPDTMFSVTKAGKDAMREASPKPPKVSAGTKRFAEYRRYSDANCCTFREWLDIRKTDWYKDMQTGSWR